MRKASLRSLILLTLMTIGLLVGDHALATENFAQTFLEAGSQIPRALQALGYAEFGRLNLAQFLKGIQNVPVEETTGHKVIDLNDDSASAGRASARWDGKKILVDQEMWKFRPGQHAVLALHEYLGFMRFDDHQYWLSMELWFLSQPETRGVLMASELQTLENRIAQLTGTRLAGGVVGVGGGGESGTLFARMNLIQNALKKDQRGQSKAQRSALISEIGDKLESNLTAMYMTPKMNRKAEENIKKMRPACLTSRGLCTDLRVLQDKDCVCKNDPNNVGLLGLTD